MTREKLINEAVAKALGWVKCFAHDWQDESGNLWDVRILSKDYALVRRVFPHIEKMELWPEFYARLHKQKSDYNDYVEGARDLALATPLQICEAFLRATGNWTKEMEEA